MYKELSKLIVYASRDENEILNKTGSLYRLYDSKTATAYELREKAFEVVKDILDLSTAYAFEDDLWQSYLTYYLVTCENSFSVTCERRGASDGSINDIVKNDLKVFMRLFRFDFSGIEDYLDVDCFTKLCNYRSIVKPELMYNSDVSACVNGLRKELAEAGDVESFFDLLSNFYKQYGTGIFGMNRAFRITDDEELVFEPVRNMDNALLSDLVGYEIQKKALVDNTVAFIEGRPANNVLLFGDRGTG